VKDEKRNGEKKKISIIRLYVSLKNSFSFRISTGVLATG
jgi:hypothetical protein